MDGKDLEKKKNMIKKFDPALAAVVVKELIIAKRIEKADVDKAKMKIKEIYTSLPATKDRAEIVSRALDEVNSEVVAEELQKIKSELADLDKDELIEISKELSTAAPECTTCLLPELGCGDCIHHFIVACTSAHCVGYNVIYCPVCITYSVVCPACVTYAICTECVSYRVTPPCRLRCIRYLVGCSVCLTHQIVIQGSLEVPELIEPQINSIMKEKIVEAVVDDPRLSKAMRKLIAEMKKKGEI
jgi:hypothetical protein